MMGKYILIMVFILMSCNLEKHESPAPKYLISKTSLGKVNYISQLPSKIQIGHWSKGKIKCWGVDCDSGYVEIRAEAYIPLNKNAYLEEYNTRTYLVIDGRSYDVLTN